MATEWACRNSDSPLLKDNNYYFYDWSGGRIYLPWDLDSAMKRTYDVFTGTVPGGTTEYTDVLFSNWEDDYDRILTDLLADQLTLDVIHGELDRALIVAGSSLDADPFIEGGPAADAVQSLKDWWSARIPAVEAQVAAH